MWGGVPIRAWIVRYVRRISCSVQFFTPHNLSRVTLLLLHPQKGLFVLPRAWKKRPSFLQKLRSVCAVELIGIVCSRAFFVALAGIVRVLFSRSTHEDCIEAISPRRWPVRISSGTILLNAELSACDCLVNTFELLIGEYASAGSLLIGDL